MSLAFLLFALWLFRSTASVLDAAYFWQLKEYRWDRMKVFLFQQGGRQHFFSVFHFLLLVFLLAYAAAWLFISVLFEPFSEYFPLAVSVVFLSEMVRIIHHVFLRVFKRPRWTLKSALVVTASLVGELIAVGAWWWYASESTVASFAFVLGLLVLFEHDLVAFVVFVLNSFSRLVKRRIFKRAQAKRLRHQGLIVVGITGSYGKTSVKEYLTHILAGKYRVLKTDKNTNTEIGIAQTILRELRPEHEIFVCEMGAYKKGEISVCAQIARPQIGVFTGLNNQHAALFGSIDETFKAKWELINALPADGLAVFNVDSAELQQRIQPPRCPSIKCSLKLGDAVAENVFVSSGTLEFTYKGTSFVCSLTGSFQIINLLMAIVVAEHLGMSLDEIFRQVVTIRPPDKTMVLTGISRGYILDDSYNVNSDGLKSAVEHLRHFPDHKKVLFFPGILELGDDSLALHEKYGEFISHHVDYAFFTDPNFSPSLKTGALKGGLSHAHIYESASQQELFDVFSKFLESQPHEKFVFLFESRGAEKVMEWLKKVGE